MEEVWQGFLWGLSCLAYRVHTTSLIAGLILGSYLKVVVCRHCLNEGYFKEPHVTVDNSTPASCCPLCQNIFASWPNITIVSWLLRRGRGYYCDEPNSVHYPLSEVTCGVVFLCISFFAPTPVVMVQLCVLAWFLIALSMIDYFTLHLPDALTQPLMWSGLVLSVSGIGIRPESAIYGAVFGYLSLWGLYWLYLIFTRNEGIGYGDFKLLAAIGAWVGWEMLPLVCTLAALCGILFSLCRQRTHHINQLIPFGPSLSAAGFLIYISQMNDELWLM